MRGEDNISLLFESHISRLRYYYLVARISLSDGDILVARKYFEEAIALLQSSPASETLFVRKKSISCTIYTLTLFYLTFCSYNGV